jgi:membrane protease subunit HflC
VLISESQRTAEEIKGKGDQEAINVYAKAYNKDKEFYEFYRKMEAYKNSLNKDMTVILSPEDSHFLSDF